MESSSEETPAKWKGLASWLITQTGHHAHRVVADGFSSVHSHGYHYRVLATLEEFGPASQATLSRRSSIHTSELVATINELAEQELVERTPDPFDRRRNIVSLTSAGERHLRRLENQVSASQDEFLAPLSAKERKQLTALLSRLLNHHEKRAGSSE